MLFDQRSPVQQKSWFPEGDNIQHTTDGHFNLNTEIAKGPTYIVNVVVFARSNYQFQQCCARYCVKNTKQMPTKRKIE